MVDGRRKGNSFEVEMAYAFSNWVCPPTEGVWQKGDDIPFRRRPADKDAVPSDWVGGRDLMHHPQVRFPFSVECKNDERWTVDALFTAPTKVVLSWWAQCAAQAAQIGLRPLLILSRNRHPTMAVLAQEDAPLLSFGITPSIALFRLGEARVSMVPLADLFTVPAARLDAVGVLSDLHVGGGTPVKIGARRRRG